MPFRRMFTKTPQSLLRQYVTWIDGQLEDMNAQERALSKLAAELEAKYQVKTGVHEYLLDEEIERTQDFLKYAKQLACLTCAFAGRTNLRDPTPPAIFLAQVNGCHGNLSQLYRDLSLIRRGS